MELEEGDGFANYFHKGAFKEVSTCRWKTVGVFALPSIADFEDYSDLARRGNTIAVTSQASSALLLATMTLDKGKLNPKTFAVTEGSVLKFAPSGACQVEYCNVEAIDFLSDRLLVGASDSMKGQGSQGFQCLSKDQSVHVFALPHMMASISNSSLP